MQKDLYKILQINHDASIEIINSAYRTLATKYHHTSPEYNPEKLEEINYAYEILCNPITRKKYDESLKAVNLVQLSPVFPQINKPKATLQNLINLLYENINFESLNHNPTKSRIYQEIYDEVIKNKKLIETSEIHNNPLWKILKTYRSYFSADEFNSLALLTAQIFNIDEDQTNTILNKIDSDDIPFKKIYTIAIVIFIASILGILLAYKFFSKDNSKEVFFKKPSDNQVVNTNTNTSNQEYLYFARIINLGMPVNLRSAPSTEWDNVKTKINAGEVVEIIEHKPNGWYYIKKDDLEGFIYGGLLEDNNYPGAFPIIQIIKPEIKVFDKNHKVFRILNERDRMVVFFQNNDHYYITSEKGNLIGIKKDAVVLENPQKTEIPYIEDSVKDSIEYFAISSEQIIIEDAINNDEDQEVIDENQDTAEINSDDNINLNSEKDPDSIEILDQPPVIFPGNTNNDENSIDSYLQKLKISILNNWNVPEGLKNYGTVVNIRIGKDGSLQGVKMVQSSGNIDVDEASIHAVKLSAPFKPFPKSFDKNYIDIQFNFDDKS
ncbi:MAG: TonB family protein [Cyanobacteriota bacterium]